MTISVIVPVFNHWRMTRACLAALTAATPADALAEIIVVDDGSNDGESAAWAAAQRTATPVLLPANGGFSRACNAGARVARGDALLFLNNDAFVRPGALDALRDALDDDGVGITGARLLYADGSLQHAGLGLLDGPVSRWWHVHRQLSGTLPDATVARDLLAVTGAALMIRRPLFEALDGFDTGFLNGWEDVDLCLRAWRRGMRVRYVPQAAIEHWESATLGRRHDDTANETRFIGRWSDALANAPRYPLAEIPPIALALRGPVPRDERWARGHLRAAWSRAFGASVRAIRAGSRLERAGVEVHAALARRRPTLEVAWGAAAHAPPTGVRRAVYVAPQSASEARRDAAARAVVAWWTPTAAAADALAAAGVPAAAIDVVPLGAAAPLAVPAGRGSPRVAAARADADVLATLQRQEPGIATVVLRDDRPPALDGVDIVIARRGGDRWGLLVPAALVHGCTVIATAPLDAHLTGIDGVVLVDESGLIATAIDGCRRVAESRAAAPFRAASAQRRLDADLAAQRAAQLARALVHGIPSAATVAVDAGLARHLRAAGALGT